MFNNDNVKKSPKKHDTTDLIVYLSRIDVYINWSRSSQMESWCVNLIVLPLEKEKKLEDKNGEDIPEFYFSPRGKTSSPSHTG